MTKIFNNFFKKLDASKNVKDFGEEIRKYQSELRKKKTKDIKKIWLTTPIGLEFHAASIVLEERKKRRKR